MSSEINGRQVEEADQWKANGPRCAASNPAAQPHRSLTLVSNPTPSSPHPVHPFIHVHLSCLFSVCLCVCVRAHVNPVFITFPDTLTLSPTNPDEAYQSYHFWVWNILCGHRFDLFGLSHLLFLNTTRGLCFGSVPPMQTTQQEVNNAVAENDLCCYRSSILCCLLTHGKQHNF